MAFEEFWYSSGAAGGGGGDPGDPIGQSLRFRGGQFLDRAISGTLGTHTISFWCKIADNDTGYFFSFTGTGAGLRTGENNSSGWNLRYNGAANVTTEIFRDFSAWYHVVLSQDATTARVYVNNVEVISTNDDIHSSTTMRIGRDYASSNYYLDGYLADFYMIDGQALLPTAFGRENANGVWVPRDIDFNGTWGTNGFHLDFSDPDDIGEDSSGNNNDFTATGFELTTTTSPDYDLMQDSPTQNWATLNPLAISNPAEGKQYEKANLGLIAPNLPMFASTIAMPNGTGIYYWELQNQTATGGIGVCSVNSRLRDFDIADENTLITDNGTVVLNGTINSNAWNNAAFGGGLNQVYGCQYNSNTRRVRFYLNGEQPTFTSVVPVGDNEFDVPEEWGDVYAIGSAAAASGFVNINYGQQPFLHQPAGTVALQTQNLPEATIANGRDHFQALTGPGTGIAAGTFPNQLNGDWARFLTAPGGFLASHPQSTAFSDREASSIATDPNATITFEPDTPIAFTTHFRFSSNHSSASPGEFSFNGGPWTAITGFAGHSRPDYATNGQTIATGPGQLESFRIRRLENNDQPSIFWMQIDDDIMVNSGILDVAQDIFPNGLWWIKDRANSNQHQLVDSVRPQVSGNYMAIQSPSRNYTAYAAPSGDSVAWCWDSSDPAETGFEIVTHTGTFEDQAINHNLGRPIDFIITQPYKNNSFQIFCNHSSLPSFPGSNLYLSANSAAVTSNHYHTPWTDTQFGVAASSAAVNENGVEYVNYCWAAIPGYSAFGSYTGNGNANGTFSYLGFRPALVIIKPSTSASDWSLFDSTNNPSNPADNYLFANTSTIPTSSRPIDMLSNGFKPRSDNSRSNNNGTTYVYAAFAENPFQSPVTAR